LLFIIFIKFSGRYLEGIFFLLYLYYYISLLSIVSCIYYILR